jgi:hypothetical protein
MKEFWLRFVKVVVFPESFFEHVKSIAGKCLFFTCWFWHCCLVRFPPLPGAKYSRGYANKFFADSAARCLSLLARYPSAAVWRLVVPAGCWIGGDRGYYHLADLHAIGFPGLPRAAGSARLASYRRTMTSGEPSSAGLTVSMTTLSASRLKSEPLLPAPFLTVPGKTITGTFRS